MAEQRSATGILEQHNVVMVAAGVSTELPGMVIPTTDSLIVSGEIMEQSIKQEQPQSEVVGEILQQTMPETVPQKSLTSVKYEQSAVDNNNSSTESVVNVVASAGEIVNTVTETSTVLQSVVTTESIASPSVVGSVSTVDTVNVVGDVSSLSIPQVDHIAQSQIQESVTGSSGEEHTTSVVVVSRPNDDKGGHQVVDGVLVPEIHENVVVGANGSENQPDTNTDNDFVTTTGNFAIVTAANLTQQPSSLSETISMSGVDSTVTGDDGGDDGGGGGASDGTATAAVASTVVGAGVQETFHHEIVNAHATTLPIHVIATNRGVTTDSNMVNNNNNSNPGDTVQTDLVHHPLQTLVQSHPAAAQQQADGILEEGLITSGIGTQNIVVEQQFVNNDYTTENGCLVADGNGELNDNSCNGITPQNSISITLAPSNDESGAPLGSSQNPIRIIQQGNQYTPLQQLTTDQLQQIMQVVQQQQLARSTQAEGSSILYNPQTNTRIVYRVIYPSELHKSITSGIVETCTPDGTTVQTRVETQSQGQQTVTLNQLQRRPYRRRNKEEEEKIDGPELSKEEKEERKKHRPRTRSGRVSKPPKHMVKDYKHIHVLDWDEDYDDSDGGYSDFKYSEDEEAERRAAAAAAAARAGGIIEGLDEPYIHPGLGSSKPKNFKCDLCSKAYIGRAGLARHYRLNPSHGQLSAEDELELRNQVLQHAAINGMTNSSGNLSEDSNTQDSLLGLSSGSGRSSSSTHITTTTITTPINTTTTTLKLLASANSTTTSIVGATTTTPTVTISSIAAAAAATTSKVASSEPSTTTTTSTATTTTTGRTTTASAAATSKSNGVGGGGTVPTVYTRSPPTTNYISTHHVPRGPGRRLGHHLHETPAKRKARLKELIKQCEDEELMEIVLPRLATVITVWEFLLMKVEKGRPSKPQMGDIFKEFESLHKCVQKMCQKYLVPVTEQDGPLEGNSSGRLNVQNPALAKSLGLSVGTYDIKEVPIQEEKTFQYKLLTTDPSSLNITPGQTNKRTIELVTQDQLVSQPPNKRIRVVSLNSADLSDLSQYSRVTLQNPTEPFQVQGVNNTNNLPQLSTLSSSTLQPPAHPSSSLPLVTSSLANTNTNTQPLGVAATTHCDSISSIDINSNNNNINSGGGGGSVAASTGGGVGVGESSTCTVVSSSCETVPVRTVVCVNTNSGNEAVVGQLAQNGLSSVTTSLVNGIGNATNAMMLPVTVMTHPSTPEVLTVSTPLSISSKTDTSGGEDNSGGVGVGITPSKAIATPMDIGGVVGDIQCHPQQTLLTTPNTVLTPVTDSVNTSTLVVNNKVSPPLTQVVVSQPTPLTQVVVSQSTPLTQVVSQPTSLTQVVMSQPTPLTQVVVSQSTPLTQVVSSPVSCPITQLSQISDTVDPQQQQTLQNLTNTTTPMVTAPVACVEEHVVEVPVTMEQNLRISGAVPGTAGVLELDPLNPEAHALKTATSTFETMEQDQQQQQQQQPTTELVSAGQIIFEDSVVTSEQLVSQPNIFQTEDGIIIIQKSDGTTMQIQGEQPISLETMQAVFAMDPDQIQRIATVQQQQQQQQQTTDLDGQEQQ